MFYLNELPNKKMLNGFKEDYPFMEPQKVLTFLELMKVSRQVETSLAQYFTQHNSSFSRFIVLMTLEREESKTLFCC